MMLPAVKIYQHSDGLTRVSGLIGVPIGDNLFLKVLMRKDAGILDIGFVCPSKNKADFSHIQA